MRWAIAQEEVFGPVLVIKRSITNEAIGLANNSAYGWLASVGRTNKLDRPCALPEN